MYDNNKIYNKNPHHKGTPTTSPYPPTHAPETKCAGPRTCGRVTHRAERKKYRDTLVPPSSFSLLSEVSSRSTPSC